MPRGKRKGRKYGESRSRIDDDASDTASVISSLSDCTSILEDGVVGESEVEEKDPTEEFEEKLIELIDGATQKSAKTRQVSLAGIQAALSKKVVVDFVMDRKITLADIVEHSLKKGKGEEQALAGTIASLLLIQLGAGPESESILSDIIPCLLVILNDKMAFPKARESCAASLALCSFILRGEVEEFGKILETLEVVFSASYFKGNGTIPTYTPDLTAVHSSALLGWSLLLSIAPNSRVNYLIETSTSRHFHLKSTIDCRCINSNGLPFKCYLFLP